MPPRQRLPADEVADELLNAYARAQAQIDAELAEIVNIEADLSRRRRLRALAADIEAMKAELDQQANEWTSSGLAQVYEAGAVQAGLGEFSWTQLHREAIDDASSRTYSELVSATNHMTTDAKRLVRASAKREVLDKLILGRTADEGSKALRERLAHNGISAIVYKDGSRHGIADYADVVMRSASAISYNVGTLNEAKQQGVKYAVLLDGFGCGLTGHGVPPSADGLILPIGEALRYPISHPRCRRAVSPLPQIRSKNQADAAMEAGELDGVPMKMTETQRDSVQQADAKRAASRKRVAQRNARLDRRIARIEGRRTRAS